MSVASIRDVPPNLITTECEQITPQLLPLVQLSQEEIDRVVASVPGGVRNVQDIYGLTPMQAGILFHHLLSQKGDPYVLWNLMSFSDRVELDAYVGALNAVIARHDVLRTALLWEGLSEPVQVVWRQAVLQVEEVVLEPDAGDVAEQLQGRFHCCRVEVRRAPMMRLYVAPDPARQRWVGLQLYHHLAVDYIALGVISAEVRAYLAGQAAQLPEAGPYRRVVAHMRHRVAQGEHEAFFRLMLGDVEEPTAPFGLLEAHGDGEGIVAASCMLGPMLSKRLRKCARVKGVSAASVFHVAWGQVLARASGQDEPVFGTVLFGQMYGNEVVERVMGLFVNTLPVRIRLGTVSVERCVRETHRQLAQLLRYAHAPLAEVQRYSQLPAGVPLFTALLNYRSGVLPGVPGQDGFLAAGGGEHTHYALMLSVDDFGEEFGMNAKVDSAVGPERLCAMMLVALEQVVSALESRPSERISELEVLPVEERERLLVQWNETRECYPSGCIHELFDAQAARTPEAVAVVYEDKHLSYAELAVRSNQLAHHLKGLGVGADDRVALCVPRSPELLVGILGVLKAGAAYVPLDPSYPAERLRYMLEDAAPRVLLTQGALKRALALIPSEVVLLEDFKDPVGQGSDQNLGSTAWGSATDLAYVIYTSGSTGKPKGAGVYRVGLGNLLQWYQSTLQLSAGDRALVVTSASFDLTQKNLLGPLLSGGCVHLASEPFDPLRLVQTLESAAITLINLTPSGFYAIADADPGTALSSLRHVVLGGEPINASRLAEVVARYPQLQILNSYGPTECADVCAFHFLSLKEIQEQAPIPIGRPVPNTRLYVLDRRGELVPEGVVGEIYVGGIGVGSGYLSRPELTAERFVKDPFSEVTQARMYKTGDLGRWRADGNIEYLGRNDHQVKIRGFRIELGEIEAQLLQHPQVKEAVVVAREDEPGEKRLVAYVVSGEGVGTGQALSVETLRAHLKPVLPDYMVPGAFVMLESLPLSANGKLDRRALPAPERGAYGSREYEAPQGEIEEILAGIWQALLRVERVGRHDTFFELGGHSLLIVQMMERLRRVGLSAQVREVFDAPTLAELASVLGHGTLEEFVVPANLIPADCEVITPQMLPLVELEAEHIERIVQAVPGGVANVQDIYPLAPLQAGILFHHLLEQDKDVYARAMLLSLDSQERVEKLVAALQAAIDRHDILRTAVLWEQLPQPVQVVYRRAVLQVEEITPDQDRDPMEQFKERMGPERQRLDLRQAPLLRLQVVADSRRGQWHALLQTHHLICDDVSVAILLSEVIGHLQDCEKEFPKPVAYRNHVAQALASARAHDAEEFFRGKLGDVEEPTAPFGLLDVHGDGSQVEAAHQDIELDISRRVRVQARRLSVSAATLFHAAWALVVAHTSGRDDVVFGTVLLGRLQGSAGAQRILGMFINTLPLRIPLREVTAKGLVERTQREVVELLGHEQASLALAQRCSGVAASTPLFSSLLNYRHGESNSEVSWSQSGATLVAGAGGTNYPITVSVDDRGEGFSVTAETDRRIDPRRMVQYVCAAVQSLVEALERAPQTPALSLSILPESERRQVLELFNATEAAYPRDELIHELFEEQVQRTPSAVAVVYEGHSITYAELNAKANQLAHYLRERQIGPDQLVGICVERSLEMVIGLLGILKAGGAYVPLDPSYPRERLKYLLQDAAPKVVLTQEGLRERLAGTSARLISLDREWDEIAELEASDLSARDWGLTPNHLAYVIYTSGSTGQPKGVMVEHRGLLNYLQWAMRTYAPEEGAGSVVSSSFAFDATVTALYTPLLCGRSVVLLREGDELEGLEAQLRGAQTWSLVKITPAHLKLLGERLQGAPKECSVRAFVIGGEALQPSTVEIWRSIAPQIRLINEYGPTETVVGCSTYEVPAQWVGGGSVPIGRPIANMRMYVLDAHRQPVPIGVAGEIYIGGVGVARGYLNRDTLTAERFVSDPFSQDVPAVPAGDSLASRSVTQARLYKTGDVGRWHADGNLEYLGRNDHQVKIRGFRIELGEIEAQLLQHPQVKEAVVLARQDVPGDWSRGSGGVPSGEKRLVGYVVSRESADMGNALSVEGLRAHLKSVLPEYMVPSAFVMLESLPLTPNGKLDRKALPAPEQGNYPSQQYEAPQGEIEERLAEIWQELLHSDRVGRHDDFFEVGGHSLYVLKLIMRIKERFTVDLSPMTVFRNPTLQQLAATVRSTSSVPVATVVGGVREKGVKPSDRSSAAGVAPTPVPRLPTEQIPSP